MVVGCDNAGGWCLVVGTSSSGAWHKPSIGKSTGKASGTPQRSSAVHSLFTAGRVWVPLALPVLTAGLSIECALRQPVNERQALSLLARRIE